MCNFAQDVNPTCGGITMDSKMYWQLFLDTGAPEAYLLYHASRRAEDTYVSDNQSAGTSGIGL